MFFFFFMKNCIFMYEGPTSTYKEIPSSYSGLFLFPRLQRFASVTLTNK